MTANMTLNLTVISLRPKSAGELGCKDTPKTLEAFHESGTIQSTP